MSNKKNSIAITIILCLLSVVFGVCYCVMKFYTFGWITLLFMPVFGLYALVYVAASICNGVIPNRNIWDHLRYWALTITFLLSGLTFVDFGDTGPSAKLLPSVPDGVLELTCSSLMVLTVILSIVSFVMITIRIVKQLEKRKDL